MTDTTPALTAESQGFLEELRAEYDQGHMQPWHEVLAAIEAAAIARERQRIHETLFGHIDDFAVGGVWGDYGQIVVRSDDVAEVVHERPTDMEGRVGSDWAATNRDLRLTVEALEDADREARHVRETGCEGLREAVRGLIDAIETTGLHEHDDGRGGVDLCIPISGIRGAMHVACEASGHEFLHPEDVPPFCRWCGAALASPATEAERSGGE